MSEATDKKILANSMNWIAFVFLVVVLATINLLLYLLPIAGEAKGVLAVTSIFINTVFWIDSFYWLKKLPGRRYLTEYYGRLAFVGNLPFLTPLRLLQSFLFFRKLRRMHVQVARDIRVKQNSQGVLLLFLFVAIVVFQMASVFILVFESQAPGANITTSGDALWWSLVTVATVGYGDKFPVTSSGRIVALFLMIVGIAMFGVLTSALSDWFRPTQRIRQQRDDKQVEAQTITADEMRELLEQQNAILQKKIDELADKLNQLEGK
jgi:voltage-gated potassium channel